MRLMVLRAAKAMDLMGNAEARVWVSAVKAMVPERVCQIIDQAIQLHGATGVSQWTPLADMYTEPAHDPPRRRTRRGAPHGGRSGGDRPLPADLSYSVISRKMHSPGHSSAASIVLSTCDCGTVAVPSAIL